MPETSTWALGTAGPAVLAVMSRRRRGVI